MLDEYGIPFISDEVQTGWGRTGDTFWGISAHDVVPDVMTFAKGLGNGLSIGGVVARGELMDGLTANSISTFGGNPLSTRRALATLDYVERHDLQANARVVGGRLMSGLQEIAARTPMVGDVRGKGLMIGVELVEPGSKAPAQAAAAARWRRRRAGDSSSARAGSTATCCGSPRPSRCPRRRPTRASRSFARRWRRPPASPPLPNVAVTAAQGRSPGCRRQPSARSPVCP